MTHRIQLRFILGPARPTNRRCPTLNRAWCGLLLLLLGMPMVRAQGITNAGGYTVFQTGLSQPLTTLALPFDVPGDAPSSFSFEFGFATAEPDAAQTFFDSFSMTLQSSNQSATALLLTADRSGVAWTPPTPGMLLLSTNDTLHAPSTFASVPGAGPELSFRLAYTVTFLVPAPFAGGPLSVFFDLFDNLNSFASVAYIKGLRMDSTGDVTVKARFYRIRSDLRTRIHRIEDQGPTVVLAYHFLPRVLELHSSASVAGPYAPETNSTLEAESQIFLLERPAGPRFYRIMADAPAQIVDVRLEGSQLVVEYDFDPQFLAVESAFTPRAAFHEEASVRREPPRRKLRVPKPGQVLP